MRTQLNRPNPSLIVPAMKKTAVLLVFSLILTAPVFAQSTEFGVLFGGSKRVIKDVQPAAGTSLLDDGFKLSNSSVDLYYAVQVDPGTMFKLRVGRINGPVAVRQVESVNGGSIDVRRDVDGEVQHAEGLVEYRFDEPFGSTGLYAGIGAYRTVADGSDSKVDFGIPIGINADFPITRRYGVVLDACYHMTQAEFRPKYVTLSGGLRIQF